MQFTSTRGCNVLAYVCFLLLLVLVLSFRRHLFVLWDLCVCFGGRRGGDGGVIWS